MAYILAESRTSVCGMTMQGRGSHRRLPRMSQGHVQEVEDSIIKVNNPKAEQRAARSHDKESPSML